MPEVSLWALKERRERTCKLESVDVELVFALLPLVRRAHLFAGSLEGSDPFGCVGVIWVVDISMCDCLLPLTFSEDVQLRGRKEGRDVSSSLTDPPRLLMCADLLKLVSLKLLVESLTPRVSLSLVIFFSSHDESFRIE